MTRLETRVGPRLREIGGAREASEELEGREPLDDKTNSTYVLHNYDNGGDQVEAKKKWRCSLQHVPVDGDLRLSTTYT